MNSRNASQMNIRSFLFCHCINNMFHSTNRNTFLAINLTDGEIHSTKCSCVQQRLGQCIHTAAVMYMALDIQSSGVAKLFQTTTDQKKYWTSSGPKSNRNPRPAGETDYGKKFKDNRYKPYDPRPLNRRDGVTTHLSERFDKFLGTVYLFESEHMAHCTQRFNYYFENLLVSLMINCDNYVPQ